VTCAREAQASCAREPVVVLGGLAPVEDCYRPDRVPDQAALLEEHGQLAQWLAEDGVDGFLIETQNTIGEACCAVRAARATGLGVWVSFACAPGGLALLSGEPLAQAVRAVCSEGAEGVGVNCLPVQDVLPALACLAAAGSPVRLAYANGGSWDEGGEWHPDSGAGARAFAGEARRWLAAGARVVGGCCGTTPDHIGAIRRVVDNPGGAE
jgi:S-methylmethionine-dependent homocysteine/selenocysteine methylase